MKNAKSYIKNKLKVPDKFFKDCIAEIPVFEWKNKNTEITNPHDGRRVIQKRLTKNTRLNFFHTKMYRAIVLVTKTKIEIQTYAFYVNYEAGKEVLEYELFNYELFSKGNHIRIGLHWEGDYSFGLNETQYMSGYYANVKFYKNNWFERIQNISELRYIDLSSYIHQGYPTNYLSHVYKYRAEIEFAQKINAKQLANDLMHPYHNGGTKKCADMRIVNMKWLKKNKQFFKNSQLSFKEFELNKRMRERHGKIVPGIEKYLDYRDISKIPIGVGIIKFQKWMIKNKINFKYYLDYLSVLKDLEIEPNVENLIIPKNLQKAHDNAVNLLNQKKDRIIQEEFEKRKKYKDILIEDYVFIMPKSSRDLIIEGKNLSHCVGSSSYISAHAKGNTTIIFIRKKENPNKSFYTMEYKHGQIIQIRGNHNISAPKEIRQAAEEWKKLMKVG